MKDERWVLIILVSLFVILAVLYVGTFTTAKIEIRNSNIEKQQLQLQLQQQNQAVNSFVSQLQICKTMKDVDEVLGTINVERIK